MRIHLHVDKGWVVRLDLDKPDLLSALEGLEQSRNDDDMALVNTRGVHARLEGLVREVDCLESEFDRSVGISRMSLVKPSSHGCEMADHL